jgi:hypothetical protein
MKPHHIATVGIMLLALTGCATRGPDTGLRQVSVSCVDPATPDVPANLATREQLRAMDGPTRFVRMAEDYLALLSWSTQVKPVLDACRLTQ